MIEIRLPVVGLKYHEDSVLCLSGDPVRLEPEPTNPHDENAIRVLDMAERFSEPVMLGYVPRTRTEPVFRLLSLLRLLSIDTDRHGSIHSKGDIGAILAIRLDARALESRFLELFDKETILSLEND